MKKISIDIELVLDVISLLLSIALFVSMIVERKAQEKNGSIINVGVAIKMR